MDEESAETASVGSGSSENEGGRYKFCHNRNDLIEFKPICKTADIRHKNQDNKSKKIVRFQSRQSEISEHSSDDNDSIENIHNFDTKDDQPSYFSLPINLNKVSKSLPNTP